MTNTRKKLTLPEARKLFATERAALNFFINAFFGGKDKIHCTRCGSTNINLKAKHPTMPWRCRDCRKHFSIRTNTVMERSKLPLTEWAEMLFTMSSELRSRPAKKVMNDFGHTYKTAWHMNHRIRAAFANNNAGLGKFKGTVEIDETAIGGKAKFMSPKTKRNFKERGGGTGWGGKVILAAAKERETGKIVPKVIQTRDKETLQGLVYATTLPGATVMTDEARGYKGMTNREHLAVNHSAKKYVDGEAHVAGVESFWSTFKHGISGSFYKISPKHTELYAQEFAGRQNDRNEDTFEQMDKLAKGMRGVKLPYNVLIADRGLDNFARPIGGSIKEQILFTRKKIRALKAAEKTKGLDALYKELKDLKKLDAEEKAAYVSKQQPKVDPLPDDEIPF